MTLKNQKFFVCIRLNYEGFCKIGQENALAKKNN